MKWWSRYNKSDILVILSFLTLFVSIFVTVFGRMVGDFFQGAGQIIKGIGTIGGGLAIIGISVLVLMYPRPFTKWTLMPPSPIKDLLARLSGVLLFIAAMGMIVETVWSFL